MSATPPTRSGGPTLRRLARAAAIAGRAAARALLRVYALVLMAVIVWLSWLAFDYLFDALFQPARAPAQITGLPRHIEFAPPPGEPARWPGLRAAEHPRTPPAHYHRIDTGLQRDPLNDCTRGGCHAPLPHERRQEVRAFLNMHATSIHCTVCHSEHDARPLPLVWYDLERGAPRSAPALLQAYRWLDEQAPGRSTPSGSTGQQTIVELLRRAAREAGDEPALSRLAEHLAAVRPTSEEFRRLLEVAREVVPRHFRGAYGAKLALRDGRTGRPVLGYPQTRRFIAQYLAEAPALAPERREELLRAIHPQRRSEPLTCTTCHSPEQNMIDHAALGYPPRRIEALRDPLIFQMIEHISRGTPFHLPQFLGPGQP